MAILNKTENKEDEANFVSQITEAALRYMTRRVSQRTRNDWTGQAKDTNYRSARRITISLTHKCGSTKTACRNVQKGDFARRSSTAAAQLGVGMAKELIINMEAHGRQIGRAHV